MKRIKMSGNQYLLFVLLLILISISSCSHISGKNYELEVFELEKGGFGYAILDNQQLLIYQPFIPVISGKKPFIEKEDARKTGELIIKKLENGEELSLTREDLYSLNLLPQENN